MTIKIKLMADYACDPLWWIEGDKVGNIDLETLPISQELIQKLREWATIYSNTLNWDDPANSVGFINEEEKYAFVKQGYQLADQLVKELGNNYSVFYFNEMSRKLIKMYSLEQTIAIESLLSN
jgi:hypothetical protein